MPLAIDSDQAAIVAASDTHLENAFNGGTQAASVQIVGPTPGYSLLGAGPRASVKLIFKSLIAAALKALNIHRPLPTGLSTTVALAKVTPSGSNGSITYVDGFVTSYTPPT